MSKYRIVERNGKFRVQEALLFFFMFGWVTPTFGDGCGNDTGVPVEYDTKEECEDWIKRSSR